MRWTDLLALAGLQDDVPALSRKVAALTRTQAEAVVGDAIVGMSKHEALGYVRARLRRVIRNEVQQAVAKTPALWRDKKQAAVYQATVVVLTQQLVDRVERQHEAPRRLAA